MEKTADKLKEEPVKEIDSSSDSDEQGEASIDENDSSTQPGSKDGESKVKKNKKKQKKSTKARIIFNVSGISFLTTLNLKILNMML
jgi:hypothetical protein